MGFKSHSASGSSTKCLVSSMFSHAVVVHWILVRRMWAFALAEQYAAGLHALAPEHAFMESVTCPCIAGDASGRLLSSSLHFYACTWAFALASRAACSKPLCPHTLTCHHVPVCDIPCIAGDTFLGALSRGFCSNWSDLWGVISTSKAVFAVGRCGASTK